MRVLGTCILLLALVFLTGCETTLHCESTKHLHPFEGGTRPVYVTNPEAHPREYQILEDSGIYPLTNNAAGARQLTLQPIRTYGVCANPIMLTYLTFGIIPGVLPAPTIFEYDLQTDGVTQHYSHRLPLYQRFSCWERLFTKRDNEKTMATGLKWSTLRPAESPMPLGASR